ncbi:MAG: hypothetical protein AABY11_03920 [archaeon]
MSRVLSILETNLHDVITNQFGHSNQQPIMVIYDTQSPLSLLVTQAYRVILKDHPSAHWIDYDAQPPEKIIETIDAVLPPKSLVILVQSTAFRVSVYRWRLELYDRKLKVLEHMRLSYMKENEFETYAQSLKDDSARVQPLAEKLRQLLTETTHIKLECHGGSVLKWDSRMEKPVVNDGDYSKTPNHGGGYPIGEIFSEPVDISKVNGEVEVYAYPGEDHKMRFAETPFRVHFKNGLVQEGDFPAEFQPLIAMMRLENTSGNIPVREFGLGLNNAITPQKRLTEATAFERIAGIHLSLGMKHGAYQKKFLKQKEINQRYHVDLYPHAKRIWLNDTLIFEDGQFVL